MSFTGLTPWPEEEKEEEEQLSLCLSKCKDGTEVKLHAVWSLALHRGEFHIPSASAQRLDLVSTTGQGE
jgi:hypothetical protein